MAIKTEGRTLTVTECCSCGVEFAVPAHFLKVRQDKGGTFYCPNGHSLSYTKTRVQELEDQLSKSRARAQHLADQKEATERSNRALRGQITKERKRVANGVCPCCHRSFVNLRRHMSGQHPDFVGGESGVQ